MSWLALLSVGCGAADEGPPSSTTAVDGQTGVVGLDRDAGSAVIEVVGDLSPPVDPVEPEPRPDAMPWAPEGDTARPDDDASGPSTSDVIVAPVDPTLDLQPLAGVCTADDDCQTSWCNTAYSGGYCTLVCLTGADCPEGAKCYAVPGGTGKMCWKACDSSADCRTDQFCGGGVCTPNCTQSSCGPGYICGDTGQCIPAGQAVCEPADEVCDLADNDCDQVVDEGCGPALTASAQDDVIDLGVTVLGGGGLSKEFEVQIDDDTTSLTLIAVDMDQTDELMAFWQVYGPGNTLLVNATDPFSTPMKAYPDIGALTLQIPITPEVPIQQGKYSFTIWREGDALASIWVYAILEKRPVAATPTLDVNFWFVGTPNLSAASAPNSSKFNKLEEVFTAVLDAYGINLGTLSYLDVPEPAASMYTYVDVSDEGYVVDEHAQLLKMTELLPPENRGVNFFFVQGFNGWGLLGKAGGIPGPSLLNGTYHSGVVVSLADYYYFGPNKAANRTAETMIHELGHQLGLFHTSESDGSYHDPIADTPECTTDYDGDGVLSSYECDGQGGDNLMFWSTNSSAILTEGQLYVIHRNAMMY